MNSVSKKIHQFFSKIALSFFLITVVLLIVQVIARYIFNSPLDWSESAALLCLNFFIFIFIALGTKDNIHLGLGGSQETKIKNILFAVFGLFLLYSGLRMCLLNWHYSMSILPLPTGVKYIPMTIAGLLMSFFSFEKLKKEQA